MMGGATDTNEPHPRFLWYVTLVYKINLVIVLMSSCRCEVSKTGYKLKTKQDLPTALEQSVAVQVCSTRTLGSHAEGSPQVRSKPRLHNEHQASNGGPSKIVPQKQNRTKEQASERSVSSMASASFPVSSSCLEFLPWPLRMMEHKL